MDPITLALVASAVGTVGTLSAGLQQASAAEAQGKIAQQQAKFKAAQSRRQSDQLLAKQRTGFAKAGVQIVGSPLLVIEDSTVQAELEEQAILQGGEISRDIKKAEAGAIRTRAFTNAGSSLLNAGVKFNAGRVGQAGAAPPRGF